MNSDDVLKKIQDIEQLAEEVQTLQYQKNTEDLKQKLSILREQIIQCCIYISEGTENSEYGISVEVVQLLLLLNDKYKFEQHFEFSQEIPIIFHFIKAFYSQNFWKLKELSQELTEIESYCKILFPFDKQNLFTFQDNDFPQEQNFYGRKNFNMIGYALIYGETLMQHTAVLSQLSLHDKALEKVQECFDFIKRVFKSLRQMMQLMVQIGTQNLSIFDFKSKESFDNFYRYVIFISNMELPNYREFKDDFVFVGVNTQANDTELFKKLVNDIKGEFLGQKLNDNWILDLHISNIVKLSKVQELIDKINCNVFAEEILIKLIFVMGCCIFSMAAENRFLSHNEISKQNIESQEQQQTNQPKKLLQNYSKELNLLKHPRFSFSEQIHKKAIEILYFGIDENSKLLNHFLQSFKKNYNLNMFMIQEVEEPSISSIKNSEYFSNNIIQQSINGFIKKGLNNLIKQKDLDKISKLKNRIKQNMRKKSKSPLQKLSLNYKQKKFNFPSNQAFLKKSKTINFQEEKDVKQKKIESIRAKQFLNKIKKEQEVEKLKKFAMNKNSSKRALLNLAKSPMNNKDKYRDDKKKKKINSQLLSKNSKDFIANIIANKSAQNNNISQQVSQNNFNYKKDSSEQSNQLNQQIMENKIPLINTNAGPNDSNWIDRLKEEYLALIKYVEVNKKEDNDWFKVQSDKTGKKWTGKCWIIYEMTKYEFDLEFEVIQQDTSDLSFITYGISSS